MSSRPQYIVRLQPEKHVVDADAIRALRQLLKIALRRFGLRCISVEQVSQGEPVVQP